MTALLWCLGDLKLVAYEGSHLHFKYGRLLHLLWAYHHIDYIKCLINFDSQKSGIRQYTSTMIDTQTAAGAAVAGVPAGLLDDFELDILGQQPLLKIFTQITHCYPLADSSDAAKSRIVNTLETGLERLASTFPWVAGQVVQSGASEGNTGVFHIRPLEKTPKLVIKDFTKEETAPDGLTWKALEEADFPMKSLDESIIAPITTFSQDPVGRVFAVQATFIEGGLILTFSAHHAVMDMVGEASVISWFSKACAGEEFTEEDVRTGNMSRRNLIPLFNDTEYDTLDPNLLSDQIIKPKEPAQQETQNKPQETPPPAVWAHFTFSPSALADLKSDATKSLPSSTPYITTDDALTALTWACTTRIRAPSLPSTTTTSSIARAINSRPYFGLPANYPGLFQNMTYATLPLDALTASTGTSTASAALRAKIDKDDIVLRTRAVATHMTRAKDKSDISFTAAMDAKAGIMLSSWARIDSYELGFGLGLGGPRSVRRPMFMPVPSLAYLLPRTPEGSITLALCLEEGEMDALRRDEEWCRYARYVG